MWRSAISACVALAACTDAPPVEPPVAVQEAYVKGVPSVERSRFGNHVALSADGTTLAASAPGDPAATSSGSVDLYVRSTSGWTHEAHLTSPSNGSDFGSGLSLSADGNTLAVGAQWDPVGCGCPDASGAVYVYTRTGTTWSGATRLLPSRQGAGFFFGNAVVVSADGTMLVAGASGTGSGTQQTFTGAAYAFTLVDGAWTETNAFAGVREGFHFGGSLALSADSSTLAIGEAGYDGAVHVYERAGTDWIEQERISGADGRETYYFGWDMALSGDGSILAVGAPQPGAPMPLSIPPGNGAVFVFERSASGWRSPATLEASNGAVMDMFGSRVVLSANGRTLFASAPRESGGSGAGYGFRRDDGAWTTSSYVKASNAGADDIAGETALALSSNGRTLALGAINEDSAASGVGGDETDETRSNSGAVYVFAVE